MILCDPNRYESEINSTSNHEIFHWFEFFIKNISIIIKRLLNKNNFDLLTRKLFKFENKLNCFLKKHFKFKNSIDGLFTYFFELENWEFISYLQTNVNILHSEICANICWELDFFPDINFDKELINKIKIKIFLYIWLNISKIELLRKKYTKIENWKYVITEKFYEIYELFQNDLRENRLSEWIDQNEFISKYSYKTKLLEDWQKLVDFFLNEWWKWYEMVNFFSKLLDIQLYSFIQLSQIRWNFLQTLFELYFIPFIFWNIYLRKNKK